MKYLRISNFILKIYLINWIICVVMYGTHWIYEPAEGAETNAKLMSNIFLGTGLLIYLIPLLSMYESAVKSHYVRKKIGDNLLKMMRDHSAADNPSTKQQAWNNLEKEWAMKGECDCERCTSIRESIQKEEKS